MPKSSSIKFLDYWVVTIKNLVFAESKLTFGKSQRFSDLVTGDTSNPNSSTFLIVDFTGVTFGPQFKQDIYIMNILYTLLLNTE